MRFPSIDAFSFWLGFAAAAGIAFVIFLLRRQITGAREAIAAFFSALRERLTSGTERNWREDIYRYAQTAHLAGSLFALDDILLPPRFFYPDQEIDPNRPPPDEDLNTVIPIIPEWPLLAAIYRAPTIGVREAFAGTTPVVVLGGPGTGKSTLLAHLASRAAQADEALFPDNPTPVFVHAADLELPLAANQEVMQPLIAAAQSRASLITAANLARHLRQRLQNGACVIFLDGFDELPLSQIEIVAEWLAQFKKQFPAHRLIAAAGTTGFGPLMRLGFAPVVIAPFTADDQRALARQWHAAWQAARARSRRRPSPTDVDPHLVFGWLTLPTSGRTMFEITLRLWAGFHGDARGARPVDWLDAYLLRHEVSINGQRALGQLGRALLLSQDSAGLPRGAAREAVAPCLKLPSGELEVDPNAFLDGLVNRRLLVKQGRDRINFRYPLAAAYCAATAFAAEADLPAPSASPLWNWMLYFLAALGDVTPAVRLMLSQPADVLNSDPLTCARWLRDAPPAARWRGEIFKRLSQLMLTPTLPESLRERALTGFVASNDPTVLALFKQALGNAEAFTRRIGALGIGALGDAGSISALTALLNDPYLDVRWAAALALANIGTEAAVQTLRQGLHSGDDSVRQMCAQALARHADLGHEFLQEALKSQDLGTRRAAVYGIAETRAEWAIPMLEETRKNETQWVVRNAADALVTQLASPGDHAPRPYLPPESQGWLVAWAAQKGMGVPPGRGAIDVLNRALKEGDEPTRLAAIEALARMEDLVAARELYAALRDPDFPLVREMAFRGLTHVAAATGQRMAAPV